MPSSGSRSGSTGPAEPLKFRPIFKEKVWGGRRIESVLGKRLPGPGPFGECWEIADVEADRSVVAGGAWSGRTLAELAAEFPDAVLGRPGRRFPILVKSIDAAAPLSVQLHPGEEEARAAGPGCEPKSEAWVILVAEAGARIVHGLAEGASRESLFEAAEAGDGARVESLLGWRPVRAGDVVFLPAGTIHAIGAGILLLEIQQSSDTTYRIHDWGRPGLDGKARPLHLEEARSVRPPPREVSSPIARLEDAGRAGGKLVECPAFRVDAFRLSRARPAFWADTGWGGRRGFVIVAGVSGLATASALHGGTEASVGPGDAILFPAACDRIQVRARDPGFTGLIVRETRDSA